LAKEFGPHHDIDRNAEDVAAALHALGGASVILTTATSGKAMSSLIGDLRARGRMVVVGASPDPIEVNPARLLFGAHAVEGSLTGSPLDCEETLAFSLLKGVRPRIETTPPKTAAEAYADTQVARRRGRCGKSQGENRSDGGTERLHARSDQRSRRPASPGRQKKTLQYLVGNPH
jgi:D-arabinose 1-dehydrogenase-like Zn-dependent alcohol dehydrogenase